MTLLGTKSTHLKSVKAHDRYCVGCENYDTIVLNVFQKQIHLFGIPVFPTKKTGNAFCQKCKNTLEEEAMPELIKQQYLLVKNESRRPSGQLSGILLLLSLTLTISLAYKKTNQTELEYLAYPNKGDVYEYQINETEYSTMKIIKISKDSVYVNLNRYNVDTPSRINKIDKTENYRKNRVSLERQEINDLYNKGKILEIKRHSY